MNPTTNNTNIYNKHYTLFCNNINSSLKRELGLEHTNSYHNSFFSDWEPPTTYGLNNSERIIPQHYFKSDTNNFKDIDMFYELTKDIRNMKPLNDIQLSYIKKLPKEKIIELLEIYNNCLNTIDELFNHPDSSI